MVAHFLTAFLTLVTDILKRLDMPFDAEAFELVHPSE
jgi:hypothetical protein